MVDPKEVGGEFGNDAGGKEVPVVVGVEELEELREGEEERLE